jgi:hypothetical protein
MRRPLVVLALAGPMMLGACSASAQSAPPPLSTTAEQTVLAWFAAMNARDTRAAAALFVPSSRWETENLGQIPKNAFTNLRCEPQGRSTSNKATIHCTFKEAPGSWSGNPDTWWDVHLEKTGTKWLITDHGQG